MLDTGDALVGGNKLGDKTRGEAIVAGMNLMGYDAMALGPKELGLGLPALRKRMAEATFPMLSANVVLTGTQTLLAEPYAILEVGERHLGVIGLTRPLSAPASGLLVTDPVAAARRYVPEVKARAGTVIVLTNLEMEKAEALAQAVPGIDLVVAAIPQQQLNTARRVPQTGTLLVVADLSLANHSGRRLGILQVMVQPDGSLSGEKWQGLYLDKSIPDDPAMAALLAKYK